MASDTRRAPASWMLCDASGHEQERGEAEAVIDDHGLNAGLAGVAFLDVDALRIAGRRIELELWPDGRLALKGLGRRHDAFVAELRRARNAARVAGMLAHAPEAARTFEGTVDSVPAGLAVYSTHLTVVPADGDPWQLPLGAVQGISRTEDPPGVTVKTAAASHAFGQLARLRDAFFEALVAARNAQSQWLERLTGERVFSDGQGIERARLAGFDSLLRNFSAPERHDGAQALLARCSGGEPRIGFVQLLDPGDESVGAKLPLPKDWASFLLVPAGRLVVMEILAGPCAATYVFEGEIGAVNADLQALHFRRAALALGEAEAKITTDNPHRLALRKLAPLQRLRAATRARLIHDEGWEKGVASL